MRQSLKTRSTPSALERGCRMSAVLVGVWGTGSEMERNGGQSFDLPDALRAGGVRALIFHGHEALAETVGRNGTSKV
jgi:hypothetical protein